jgi:hypothetical protein
MAKFKYVGVETLYFVELLNSDGVSFVAEPGQTYDLPTQPEDSRFVSADSAPAPVAPVDSAPVASEASQTAPEAPVETAK